MINHKNYKADLYRFVCVWGCCLCTSRLRTNNAWYNRLYCYDDPTNQSWKYIVWQIIQPKLVFEIFSKTTFSNTRPLFAFRFILIDRLFLSAQRNIFHIQIMNGRILLFTNMLDWICSVITSKVAVREDKPAYSNTLFWPWADRSLL